jgi:cobalt-zinc-cadmium efflux system protein
MHVHGHDAPGPGGAPAATRPLALALGLILALMVAEAAVGVIAHSLALLSDAGHMLSDAAALGLAVVALRLARRPARGRLTFGLRRLEVLSAQANGATLLVLAGVIVYVAVRRLIAPPHVHAGLVLWVALAGALVNLIAARLLAGPAGGSLAVEGSFRHILTDLYGFLGTAVAAGVILATGFQRADPLVSLLIAALMLRAGGALVGRSSRIFLEAAPTGLDPGVIGAALAGQRGVVEVHDLHVWEISSGFPALSAHVLVRAEEDCHAVRRELERVLRERFGLDHTTLQLDHQASELIDIAPVPKSIRR